MRWLAGTELLYAPARVAVLGNAVRLYGGLALLAAMCIVTSAAMLAGSLFVRRARRMHFARAMISGMFRVHLAAMERVGSIRLDVSALDALRSEPGMLIAANHPSMIDAALMLSRLPDLACVMKPEILDNVLFGSGARMAGYITNHPPRAMLRSGVRNLQAGSHLLLFPEGTRTRKVPVNALQRTVGVFARRAGVPVQTVIIETTTGFLCKGWPLLRIPAMPMVYKLRLGRRFDPPADVDAFRAELAAYFHDELAGARLPALPLPSSAR